MNPGKSLVMLVVMFATGPALAATCTSQASGNWDDSATWTGCGGTGLPGNNDSVVIAATHTVTLNVNSANIVNVTVNAGGTLQGDNTGKILTVGSGTGGTLTVNGALAFGAGSAATVRLNRNSTWAGSGTWNLSVLDVDTRTLSFTAGTTATLNFSGASAPIAFNAGTPGTVNSLATITWNFTGAVAQTLPSTANVKYGAITANNSAGVTLGVALSTTSLLDNLSVQSGIFNDGGFAIVGNTGKTFSVFSGATFNLTNSTGMVTGFSTKTFGATSTVNYALTGNQPVSAETYGHLTLSGGGIKTPDAATNTIAGDFTLAAGVTYAGTTNNPPVNLAGDISNSGTFNSGTGTFTFNGSGGAQSLTGATTFTNMTLDNSSGLTLNSNATVDNVLTFTNGKITTGANKVIIGTAGSHTGASSARYVVGTMEKVGPVGTFTFAVGDASIYAPVTTAFSSGGATGSLAVNTTAGEHPDIANSGLDSSQDVNRYWTLTSTGLTGTYDATFFYDAGDKDGGSDPSAYEIMRYSGGWNLTTIGTRNATDTQATGLTGFGDFAIGEILPPIDHWLISHDGGMVTCISENITFTAHSASHVAVDPDLGHVLSIATSTGRGTWTGVVPPASGTLSDPTPGDPNNGDATYTFPGGESSVTLSLRYTNPAADPELTNFNVIDSNSKTEGTGTAAADADDANLSVASAGFVFYNSTDANAIYPTQIAGKRSDEGFGAKSLALRAVKASDSDPSVCAAPFSGSVSVELGAECRNPSACAGKQVSVDINDLLTAPAALAIATNNDNGAALTTGYTSVSLTFGASSTAEMHVEYPDAGQVQLHARFDLGDPAGSYMVGSSNDFVVRPFGFLVSATGNPAAVDQNGTVFTAAGEDFTVTATAKGWQSADDGNTDGIPDGHAAADTDPTNNADLSDNGTLLNFGQESVGGEDVTLSAALYLPSGGNDPGLSGGTSITSFTTGAGNTTTANYGEVGIIEISASVTDGDYLGIGGGTTALALSKSGYVGRFTPFDFNVTGNTPVFTPACNSDTTDFTYIEQPFDYGTAPQFTVTARNKQGTTTANYDDVWWKLADLDTDPDDITFTYAHDGGALPAGSMLDGAAATQGFDVDCSGGACDGAVTYTLSGPFMYTRAVTPAAPFNAAVDITLSNITDSDGVAYAGNPFKFENVVFSGGANSQRWGRLAIGQGVGDPTIPLDVTITAEYYDGTTFAQNADDDCTAFTLASDVDLTNESTTSPQDGDEPMTIGSGTTSITSGDPALADALALFSFSAPGAGNAGFVDISVDLDVGGADLLWLQFDWDSDGTLDTTTSGRASFGIFSQPDSFIYSREPW